MTVWLLKHYFLDRKRKILDSKDLAGNIIKIFLSILFTTYLVLISLYAGYTLKIIAEHTEADPYQLFMRATFYYFLFDILVRFQFQGISLLNIDYYRTLPVKRATLIHYPLLRSVLSLFNIIPLILFISVFVQVVLPNKSLQHAITWMVFFVCLILTNNFLGIIVKYLFQKRVILTITLLLGFVTLLYLELGGTIDISTRYEEFIDQLFPNPLTIVLSLTLSISLYVVAFKNIQNQFYNERSEEFGSWSFGRFTHSPTINLVLLELRLIFRNKRPKVTFFFSVFLLIYAAFYFVRLDMYEQGWTLIFFMSLAMGAFALQHGQFLFAWESSYFDRLMTNNLTRTHIIRAKYLLLTVFFVMGFLLILPYNFFNGGYFKFQAACLCYHLGITSHFTIISGYFNTAKIELSKGVFMNYEGVRFNQFLLIIPITLFPMGIFILGDMYDRGIIILMATGLLGLVLTPIIIKASLAIFNRRKIILTESYYAND